MDGQLDTTAPRRRGLWRWAAGGVVALALVATGLVAIPLFVDGDPCDRAVPFASELGLNLSDDDEVVVSCDWHTSFPDSSGTVIVRTASPATRAALLERSGVSEEVYEWAVSGDHGPYPDITQRPNLDRGKQVFTATAPNGHVLKIIYDEGVESGLLLTVHAIQQ